MLNTPFSPWPSFTQEEIEAVSKVLASNKVNYWTGEECRRFEEEFAAWLGIPEARARAARDGFFPKEGVNPDTIHGIPELMQEAITIKALAAPLTDAQLKELFQLIPR